MRLLAGPIFLIGLALGAHLQETTFAKRITAFQVQHETKADRIVPSAKLL